MYRVRNRYHPTHLNIIIDVNIDVKNKELLLHSITVTAKSSIKMKGDKKMKNYISHAKQSKGVYMLELAN